MVRLMDVAFWAITAFMIAFPVCVIFEVGLWCGIAVFIVEFFLTILVFGYILRSIINDFGD